ncbi:solute symporter family protein [Thermomonospora cellulosilytica]|uniref:Cation/acetate symporter n=1 Tax=Thermomonospora cellulosilytica TaxID=1411118 RepID=A0A7W3R9N3_9ACTN|nr:cation acetate symporter [Thermomonospora cellulosilytica]MBA9004951.1 cation/acetate symporter [Thermomonospora cellulosilytica]
MSPLAAADDGGRVLTFGLFLAFVLITLGITVWARLNTRGAEDFFAGGRSFTGPQNGLALAGDYMSAASFLGIAGIIALSGYDGFLYSIGFLVAWVLTLLLVQPIRNSGRFTLADVVAYRMRQPPVRTAAAVSTVTVSVFYLLAQMVGAGALVSLVLGVRSGGTFGGVSAETAHVATIVVVGLLMICFVMYGGMKGTTWVQIVKAALLMAGAAVLTVLVLARFGFAPGAMLSAAAEASGHGDDFLAPGLRYGREVAGDPVATLLSKLDFISLALALVLGTAGLPHIVTRFFTVPDGRAARRSVHWTIVLVGVFYLMTLVLGFGATALVGPRAIAAEDPSGNTAVPQLARALGEHVGGPVGGDLLLAFVSAVAFATILAVVSGLVIASATSLAHDFFGHVLMYGRPRESQQVAVARAATLLIGALAVAAAVFARNLNVAFLVALAFAIAASAHLPALVLALCWRRFTTTGAVCGIYGGLAGALLLVAFSPVVSGRTDPVTGESLSLFPAGVDFHWFPLENPGLVSIPFGFLCAVLGTLLGREKADPGRHTELSVRSLTGIGSC